MAINTSKVVVGGLAAGVVGNILGYVGFGKILGPRMNAEMAAAAPSLAGVGNSGSDLAVTVVSQFILGFLAVWLYAAMRPRFGPGPRTAAFAGIAIWICGVLFHAPFLTMGLTTLPTFILATVVALVLSVVSAEAGAYLYSEPA